MKFIGHRIAFAFAAAAFFAFAGKGDEHPNLRRQTCALTDDGKSELKGPRRYDKENLLWQSVVAAKSDPVGS